MTLATLVIYAYTSFVSPWSVGPEIVKKFEAKCECKVILIDVGDAGSILSRVKLDGSASKADLIVGLDAANLGKLEKLPEWEHAVTRPFDHAPLAFVYNSKKLLKPPASLDDLLDPRFKNQIAIEDPRLSTVGEAFLFWVIREKGEEGAWDYLFKLRKNIKIVAPSWDLAYGLFKKNQVQLVLSFWTSPAYHLQEEKNPDIKAASFQKGHYVQTEYAAINPQSKNPLAQVFLDFLLSKDAQGLIPKKNFMYPQNAEAPLSPAFQKLGVARVLTPLAGDYVEKNLDSWLSRWREIFSK